MYRLVLTLIICSAFFASCEKTEQPLVLPPAGTAQHGMVEMGPNYEDQIFFDLGTGKAVYTSKATSWHLAIQSDPNGRHVYMNGGNEVYTFNTHQKDLDQVVTLPSSLKSNGTGWDFDAPSGNPDSTGIGDWFDASGASKGEVYIVQVEPSRYVKMRIQFADASKMRIEWAPLETTGVANKVDIARNTNCNFSYYSFDAGVVTPEPPKETWDIVFTRYRYVYHTPDYPNFPYQVCGVLLNPNNTLAAADSSQAFDQINLQAASMMQMVSNRDVIGFTWKTYSFSSGRYEVNRGKNYVIQTRNGQLFKLHFLDFYSSSGVKGSPSFEYERLK